MLPIVVSIMSAAQPFVEKFLFEQSASIIKNRREIIGGEPKVLTDIYQKDVNIAIWQRQLDEQLALAAQFILKEKPTLLLSFTATPKNIQSAIQEALGETEQTRALCDDVALLVDMFCCLFDLKRAGLRLTSLNRAMCPRFHVDRIPCRLVTTYQGSGTQWLPHNLIDRSKLGAGGFGKPDSQSGLYEKATDVEQLDQGDIALLKGDQWFENQGGGIVHRSPSLEKNSHRLLLTLDFIND
jgi:hypothetical protein